MRNKAVSAIIGVILMVAITVAIAATVYVWVQQLYDTESEAIEMAQNYVKTRLEDPSTAQFTVDRTIKNVSHGDMWVVIGKGTTQNTSESELVSFSYTVSMTHDLAWQIKNCTIAWG
jgi:flagellin-like protein